MPLLLQKQPGKYGYAVDARQAWVVRAVGAAGLASVALMAWGYVRFLALDWHLFVLCALPFTIISAHFAIIYLLQMFFAGFDVERHRELRRRYWREQRVHPRVAVFITAAGEDPEIVEHTIAAAAAIDYEDKQVYVLDDTAARSYADAAQRHGATHISRPNLGEGKKSGNLNHALRVIGPVDQVLVLDADFVPRSEILRDMVPYTAPDIGFIQSPQHFEMTSTVFARSKIEYGAAVMQYEFYRLGQGANDRFGAAVCVGTNALYNAEALAAIGGFCEAEHGEDVETGLNMLNHVRDDGRPYRAKYLPIQLATGTCPSTYVAYYKQQGRWATGSLRLLISRKTLFSRVLTPAQKLAYFGSAMHYIYRISVLLMPLQLLALILMRDDEYHWRHIVPFVPHLIMTVVVVPFVYRQPRRRRTTMLTTTAADYTYLQALWLAAIGRPVGWEVTGRQEQAPVRNTRFLQLRRIVVGWFLAVYVGTLALTILNDKFGAHTGQLVLLQALFGLSLATQAVHLVYLYARVPAPPRGRLSLYGGQALALGSVALVSGGLLVLAALYRGDLQLVIEL